MLNGFSGTELTIDIDKEERTIVISGVDDNVIEISFNAIEEIYRLSTGETL